MMAQEDGRPELVQANAIGLHKATWNRILRGITLSPSPRALWGAAKMLGNPFGLSPSSLTLLGLAGWLDLLAVDGGLAEDLMREAGRRASHAFPTDSLRLRSLNAPIPAISARPGSTVASALREAILTDNPHSAIVDDVNRVLRSEWNKALRLGPSSPPPSHTLQEFLDGREAKPLRQPVDLFALLTALNNTSGWLGAWWAGLLREPRLTQDVEDIAEVAERGKEILREHADEVRDRGWEAVWAHFQRQPRLDHPVKVRVIEPQVTSWASTSQAGRVSVTLTIQGEFTRSASELTSRVRAVVDDWMRGDHEKAGT